jgi:predicted transcriptional regulator
MPRHPSRTLTEGELRLMETLWETPGRTVADVVAAVRGPRRPAYNTVLTILRILERKGYVRHEKRGRAFVFQATLDRDQARRGALSDVLKRFFADSPELLVLNMLKHRPIPRGELQRLRTLIDESG